MSADEGREELEEVQTDLRKRDDNVSGNSEIISQHSRNDSALLLLRMPSTIT